MSIIGSFKRLVDPIAHRMEQADQTSKRELPQREATGDPPLFVCRICALEGPDGTYCPECLADTMEPRARKKLDGPGSPPEK